MNKVFLIGNLAEEPKTSMTTGGATKCSFRLAVQRRFTNQQTGQREADFIPIVAWRQTGELCAKYLTKGRKCAVCGSIQTRSYDAKDGSKRYVTEIIIRREYLDDATLALLESEPVELDPWQPLTKRCR